MLSCGEEELVYNKAAESVRTSEALRTIFGLGWHTQGIFLASHMHGIRCPYAVAQLASPKRRWFACNGMICSAAARVSMRRGRKRMMARNVSPAVLPAEPLRLAPSLAFPKTCISTLQMNTPPRYPVTKNGSDDLCIVMLFKPERDSPS
jgi:hypothetical protein